jgi:hypothetical protein
MLKLRSSICNGWLVVLQDREIFCDVCGQSHAKVCERFAISFHQSHAVLLFAKCAEPGLTITLVVTQASVHSALVGTLQKRPTQHRGNSVATVGVASADGIAKVHAVASVPKVRERTKDQRASSTSFG